MRQITTAQKSQATSTALTLVISLSVLLISNTTFSAPPASSPELIAKGGQVYKNNCAVCHGDKGDGNGPAGAALKPKPRSFITDKYKNGNKPQQVFDSITKGLNGTSMAPFGHLPESDRWAVTYYVLSLKK